MQRVVVEWISPEGESHGELEFDFARVLILCNTPHCKKGIDVASISQLNDDELLQFATIKHENYSRFQNAYSAECPFCGEKTPYMLTIDITESGINFGPISDNVLEIKYLSPDGEKKYTIQTKNVVDPNFNFVENINKGEPAYFYSQEDGAGIDTQDVYFVPEGNRCLAIPHPDESGFADDIYVNGPIAITHDADIVTSNQNKIRYDEVRSWDNSIVIAPSKDASIFTSKLIVCQKDAPSWVKQKQGSKRNG